MKRKVSELSWQGTGYGREGDGGEDLSQDCILPICMVKTLTDVAQMHNLPHNL